jgi:GDP-4-dehydro-6-deoxy-D-mannose reductase
LADERTMLLIGAAGFLGGHVLEATRGEGLSVVAAGRGDGDALACDLLDPDSVAACVEAAAPDLVVNMAGAASVAAGWERWEETFAVNATGVLNLLGAVARTVPGAHVLCVSSAEVYGEAGEESLPFAEDLPLEPVTPYGASKAAMETVCDFYARGQGPRVAVVRAFSQIGPGQSPDFPVSGFARRIVSAERAGAEEVELAIGNLAAARDFTDVRDAARAFLEISRRELTGAFNLCTGRALKLEDLIEEMGRATPLPLRIVSDPSLRRPVDPNVVYGDPGRLREATGWQPRIPLSQTVTDLLGWWRSEQAAT